MKSELYRISTDQIVNFFENYKSNCRNHLKILCNFFIDIQNKISQEFWYIKPPEYFINEIGLDGNAYKYKYKRPFFSNTPVRCDFKTLFVRFLKTSLDLWEVIKIIEIMEKNNSININNSGDDSIFLYYSNLHIIHRKYTH